MYRNVIAIFLISLIIIMFICKQTKLKGGIFIEDIKRNQDNFIIKDFNINDYICTNNEINEYLYLKNACSSISYVKKIDKNTLRYFRNKYLTRYTNLYDNIFNIYVSLIVPLNLIIKEEITLKQNSR